MSKNLLHMDNISISFGGIKAVDGLDLTIKKGEIVSIIGPNGAGKTTVFNILTGVYKTQTGKITLNDEIISTLTPQEIVKKGISRTFQNIRLFDDMRVIENVLVGAHIHTTYTLFDSTFRTKKFKIQENENVAKSLILLDKLGLYDKKDEYAGNLPYGDQRKVEIARALATGAEIILLDEPAAGMNPQESEELLKFIFNLKMMGITVILIEHDMSVVMKISDYIYVLENGKLIAEGKPNEVSNNQRVIKAYLGGEIGVRS